MVKTGSQLVWRPDPLVTRCSRESQQSGLPGPRLSSPGEQERNTVMANRVRVNMLQFCLVSNSLSYTTLSNKSERYIFLGTVSLVFIVSCSACICRCICIMCLYSWSWSWLHNTISLVEHCVTFIHDRRLLSLLGFVHNWPTSRWSATKKENRFSLNENGIMSSFLGQQFYCSTLYTGMNNNNTNV